MTKPKDRHRYLLRSPAGPGVAGFHKTRKLPSAIGSARVSSRIGRSIYQSSGTVTGRSPTRTHYPDWSRPEF